MTELNKVVLSTRVRLARNYREFPFVPKMSLEDATKTAEMTKEAVMLSSGASALEFEYLSGKELADLSGVLLEEHLISPGMLKSKLCPAVILSKSRELSIMVNEEDHLRIQAFKPGYNPDEAMRLANLFDDLCEEKNEYAFSAKYGYLTACPTNIGTGIRVSFMMHLPAITITGAMNNLIRQVNRLGLEVRGAFGEGTGGEGNIYQISNQITLGLSEEEILEKLKRTVNAIAEQELALREKIRGDELYDRIYRSVGLLKSSYKMSYGEFLKLNSNAILGADMGIIKGSAKEFYALNERVAPNHIIALSHEFSDSVKRDIKRAEILREAIGKEDKNV